MVDHVVAQPQKITSFHRSSGANCRMKRFLAHVEPRHGSAAHFSLQKVTEPGPHATFLDHEWVVDSIVVEARCPG